MPKMILQNVRCSYVFATQERKDGGYGVQVLLPKDSSQVKKFQKLVKQALTEKFGDAAWQKKGRYKLPLRDGDEERDGAEYEGMYFFNANSGKRPGIVNKAGEPADEEDLEEYCYSGAYFHASVNVYAFDSKDGGKPGVAVGLNNLMLRKKGERLDGSVAATDDFADFAEDGDDFDDEDNFDDL